MLARPAPLRTRSRPGARRPGCSLRARRPGCPRPRRHPPEPNARSSPLTTSPLGCRGGSPTHATTLGTLWSAPSRRDQAIRSWSAVVVRSRHHTGAADHVEAGDRRGDRDGVRRRGPTAAGGGVRGRPTRAPRSCPYTWYAMVGAYEPTAMVRHVPFGEVARMPLTGTPSGCRRGRAGSARRGMGNPPSTYVRRAAGTQARKERVRDRHTSPSCTYTAFIRLSPSPTGPWPYGRYKAVDMRYKAVALRSVAAWRRSAPRRSVVPESPHAWLGGHRQCACCVT